MMENKCAYQETSLPKRQLLKSSPRYSPLKVFDTNLMPPNPREISALKIKISEYDIKCVDLEMELGKKNHELERLKAQLEECEKQKSSLKFDHDIAVESLENKLENQKNELTYEMQQMKNDLQFFKDRCTDLREELLGLYNERDELNNKLVKANDEMEKLGQALLLASQDVDTTQKKYDDLEKVCKEKAEEIIELKKQISLLQEEKMNDFNMSNESVCPEISMREEHEPLSLFAEIELKHKDEEINEFKRQISDNLRESDKKSLEIQALKEKNELLINSINSLQEKLKQNDIEQISLRSKISHLNSRLKDSYRDLKNSITKYTTYREKNLQVEKLLNSNISQKTLEISHLHSVITKREEEIKRMKDQAQNEVLELKEALAAEKRIKEEFAKQNILLEDRLKAYKSKVSDSSKHALERQDKLHENPTGHLISSNKKTLGRCNTTLYAIREPRDKRIFLPRGTGQKFYMAEEEGEFNIPRCLSDIKDERIESEENTDSRLLILRARNSKFAPHLKSSYPIELNLKVGEKALKESNDV